MKKTLVLVGLILNLGAASANAETAKMAAVTLPSGQRVAVQQDACYDPVFKTWGPCWVATPEAKAALDNLACWDPVTKRLEPCL